MVDNSTPEDQDRLQAEEHVKEIMGPADPHRANMRMPAEPESAPEPKAAQDPADSDLPDSPGDTEDMHSTEAGKEPAPSSKVDDTATDTAVDDIVRKDADAMLSEGSNQAVVMKLSFFERCKISWQDWWSNPWKRYGTIAVLAILLALVTFVGSIRAMVLNTVGVHSSVMVQVYDGATNLPLENAVLQVGGKTTKTNASGQAKLGDLRLGKQTVQVYKLAFAKTTRQVNLGVRVLNLGNVTLKPVGAQLTFMLTDYLSGKPIAGASLTSGEATAKSDANGKAIITMQPDSVKGSTITVSKNGYRTDEVAPPADLTAVTTHQLVPAAHAIFVSKASGKYDVYKMYLDGQDRSVLLPGTGLESANTVALPSPSGDKVAVASTRDDRRDSNGYLQTALNIVDVATGDITNVEYADQIHIVGWDGETLVYQQTVPGASAANPNRQKIIAYDTSSGKRFQLGNANYFVGSQLIGSTLYYATSATDPSNASAFVRINTDGSGKKVLYTGQIWSLLRTGYDTMKLQTQNSWYDYTVGATSAVVSTPSTDYTSRVYVDSPDGKTSVWVDIRDSNGVLIARNLSTSKETELVTQKSMQAPLYWLNATTVVYRVMGASEVADYAASIDGGKPQKIADVSANYLQ